MYNSKKWCSVSEVSGGFIVSTRINNYDDTVTIATNLDDVIKVMTEYMLAPTPQLPAGMLGSTPMSDQGVNSSGPNGSI